MTGLPYQTFNELVEEQRFDSLFQSAGKLHSRADQRAAVIFFLDSCSYSSEYRLRRDFEVIDSQYLIENIDLAFKAWEKPWARDLNFDDFCKYILPYKNQGDKPTRWRLELSNRFAWLSDSLKNLHDPVEVCSRVNDILKKECSLMTNFSKIPTIVHFDLVKHTGFGLCRDITNYTNYCMRAVGLAVTWDFSTWSSRSLGHDWSTLLVKDTKAKKIKFIPFLGAEINPLKYKIENEIIEYNRRAKVYRHVYMPHIISSKDNVVGETDDFDYCNTVEDVSAKFLSVSDIKVNVFEAMKFHSGKAFVTTYDEKSGSFRVVSTGIVESGEFILNDLGRNNCYLPVIYSGGRQIAIQYPIILGRDGSIRILRPNIKATIKIAVNRKYPYYDSNRIKIGEEYELLYWNGNWISLGRKIADSKILEFSDVPTNCLLILKNLTRGVEERPFTIDGNRQTWW